MTMVDHINIHHTACMAARAQFRDGTSWLEITFASADDEFKLAAFMPIWVANRVANAINAAWDAPAERLVPGRPPGIRGEDILPDRVIPLARLDALGDDGPEAA